MSASREHGAADPIGQPLPRREDARLLTGSGRYTDDAALPGQLHAAFLRSEHAHARIVDIDTSTAGRSPGVVAVYTAADLPALGVGTLEAMLQGPETVEAGIVIPPRDVLARERVRFVGEPVAMVIAESASRAMDAAERIGLRHDVLACVTDASGALAAGAPLLHEDAPDNLCRRWQNGDAGAVQTAFADAAHVVRLHLSNNRLTANALEPRAVLADPRRGDPVTVHTASQSVHALRTLLARTLQLDEHALHVVTEDVGGSFGAKMYPYPEQAMVIAAARRLGRPVRWTATRSEGLVSDNHARAHDAHAELALSASGEFLALRVNAVANMGAWVSGFAPYLPAEIGSRTLVGPYTTAALHVSVDMAFTNTTPVDAYRGAGRPEGTYLIERLADRAARVLGIDPVELRRRNLIPRDAMPWRTPLGFRYDCGDFAGNLDAALATADREGFEGRRREAATRGRLRGLGVSCFVEPAGGNREQHARLELGADGRLLVLAGSQSTGTAHETVYAQVASGRLGIPLEDVQVMQGDSSRIPRGSWTSGSRGLTDGAGAILDAAHRLVAKALPVAATLLQAAPEQVEFADGAFTVRGGRQRLTLAEVARSNDTSPLAAAGGFRPGAPNFPNGCCVAEVEIDPDTGRVTLAALSAADDFGRVVNPLVVEGQVHGALAQGAGQALLERIVFDPENGQPLAGTWQDYAMPRADDLPAFNTAFTAVPTSLNALGAKGCGEAGAIGAPPAVMNAILDALHERGVEDLDMPATPFRVWQALRQAQRSERR